jgi:hypothetical protein
VYFAAGFGVVCVVVALVVPVATNCIAAPFLCFLVFVHGVLKWLQNPLLKNVMLLHAGSS